MLLKFFPMHAKDDIFLLVLNVLPLKTYNWLEERQPRSEGLEENQEEGYHCFQQRMFP